MANEVDEDEIDEDEIDEIGETGRHTGTPVRTDEICLYTLMLAVTLLR
jgi:hypothetical protein